MSQMLIRLSQPPGSTLRLTNVGPIITAPGNSGVAVDEHLARIWNWAGGRTQGELEAMPLFADDAFLDIEIAAMRTAGLLQPPIEYKPATPALTEDCENRPLVSVVLVTSNGLHHLRECLPSIDGQNYRNIEVIIVDDRSADGTLEYLRDKYPQHALIHQQGGPNFPAGCNLGIARARGEYVFLLNNDTVLDCACVDELVRVIESTGAGGVAAMLRFYGNRSFLNGLGTGIRRHDHGHDAAIGVLDVGQFVTGAPVPMLCFGAALLSRNALRAVGALDERFGFYYEDADWSYRARAAGFELVAAPGALVFHKFGASVGSLPNAFKIRMVTRNRLRLIMRNFPTRSLLSEIPSRFVEDGARIIKHLGAAQTSAARAIARGWFEFLRELPRLARNRLANTTPRLPPALFYKLLATFPAPELQDVFPRLTRHLITGAYKERLVNQLIISDPSDTMGGHSVMNKRLLIISPDTIGANMGGVGMRYWELAHQLAGIAQVTLAAPGKPAPKSSGLDTRSYVVGRSDTLAPLAEMADVILLSGFTVHHHPFLRASKAKIVVDLYDPTMLENLERFASLGADEQEAHHRVSMATYDELLRLGDFFVCASEKQRDFWLGALTQSDRVTPAAYAEDHTLRRLIDVVPFGVPNAPPRRTAPALKGVRPGIAATDKVILWGGGMWDWLDPLSAIDAMPTVLDRFPEARLVFLGTRHPNPDVPPSLMASRAIERAEALGLKDRGVFFNDWTPYDQRVNYLLDADIGISLHKDHIETRFSVRTRLMDYFWAGLPMVVSGGDTLSDVVRQKGLGKVIESSSAEEVAQAVIALLDAPVDRSRFPDVAAAFRWEVAATPLRDYVSAPWTSPKSHQAAGAGSSAMPGASLGSKAISSFQTRGLGGLLSDARQYLLWRMRRA